MLPAGSQHIKQCKPLDCWEASYSIPATLPRTKNKSNGVSFWRPVWAQPVQLCLQHLGPQSHLLLLHRFPQSWLFGIFVLALPLTSGPQAAWQPWHRNKAATNIIWFRSELVDINLKSSKPSQSGLALTRTFESAQSAFCNSTKVAAAVSFCCLGCKLCRFLSFVYFPLCAPTWMDSQAGTHQPAGPRSFCGCRQTRPSYLWAPPGPSAMGSCFNKRCINAHA